MITSYEISKEERCAAKARLEQRKSENLQLLKSLRPGDILLTKDEGLDWCLRVVRSVNELTITSSVELLVDPANRFAMRKVYTDWSHSLEMLAVYELQVLRAGGAR